MEKETIFPMPATDKDRRQFLSQTHCMELLNLVDPKGDSIYCHDKLLIPVPIYGPEGATFVKTDKPHTIAMQMLLYADSWDNLNVKELKEKQERRRTTSGGSSSSQTDPQSKNWVSVYLKLKEW